MNHYTYYSYEEFGRGYIGKRSCKCSPEEDVRYFGSYKDKTFKPTQKIILETYDTATEAITDEVKLHDFYDVANNSHFANRAKQTSKFYVSDEQLKKQGRDSFELGYGCFAMTPEQRSEAGRKGGAKVGKITGKVNGKKNGKKNVELGRGCFAMTPEQRSEAGRKGGKIGGNIIAEKYSKEFAFISPEGEIVKGKNIQKFCRENDLSRTCINRVIRGTRSHHKGWMQYIPDFL